MLGTVYFTDVQFILYCFIREQCYSEFKLLRGCKMYAHTNGKRLRGEKKKKKSQIENPVNTMGKDNI